MKQLVAKFYNRFSIFYPLVDVFLAPQKQKLLVEINKLPNGSLLEIGVGNGSHLPLYSKHQIIGIDISSKMLENANKYCSSNITLLEMNGESLAFEDSCFDYVVLSHIIAVVENPEKLLEEVYRVLKPNGKLLMLNHFTPNNLLYYLDYTFQFLGKIFCFKSVFTIDELVAIEKFKLSKTINLGLLSYFKILIYCKG